MAVEGSEWDAMKKLLKQLYDRSDAGKNYFREIGVHMFEMFVLLSCDYFFARACGILMFPIIRAVP